MVGVMDEVGSSVDGGERKGNKTGSLQVLCPHSPEVRKGQIVGKGLIWTAQHARSDS